MPIKSRSWDLYFCAAYLVPPCKGQTPEAVAEMVQGSVLDTDSLPTDFFLPLFSQVADEHPIQVAFAAEDGEQRNAVRTLIRAVAFDDVGRNSACRELSYRLALATDGRSRKPGLFVVLAGRASNVARVLLWKFPSDQSLQAKVRQGMMTVSLLEDAFSRKGRFFKAAMFEGTAASTSFWTGTVEDRQARSRAREVSDFWVVSFLRARLAFTDSGGSRLLAKALRGTLKKTDSPEAKGALIAAAMVIKSQGDTVITLGDFARGYLPRDAQAIFGKLVGGPAVMRLQFRLDPAVLEKELKLRTIALANEFIIRGPLDTFDEVVTVGSPDQLGAVDISVHGVIASQALLKQ